VVNKLIGSLVKTLYLPTSGIEVFVVASKLKDNSSILLIFLFCKTDELTNETKSILIFIELAVAIITLCCAKSSK
jgi:hypothetical protein